jgi:hypothetical protein
MAPGPAHAEHPRTDGAHGSHPWVAPLGWGAAALVGCVALAVVEPSDGGLVLCPFRAVTGLDCPGCGMTRAVGQLTRGRIAAAADYNLALTLVVPALLYLYGRRVAAAFGRDLPALRPGRVTSIVLVAGLIAFALVRNLPIGIGRYLNADPSSG